MNTKLLLIVAAIAVFVASIFIDSRLTPFVGAAALLGVIVYAWAANRSSSAASAARAEQATRRQKNTHTGPRS